MSDIPVIWLIGGSNKYVDRSIKWDEEFPILSDPDILIIPLSSLTVKTIKSLGKSGLKSIQEKIFNKFISGGKIIFILEKITSCVPKEEEDIDVHKPYTARLVYADPPISNYVLSPIFFDFQEVSEIKITNYHKRDEFSVYLSNIKAIHRIIKTYYLSEDLTSINPFNPIVKNVLKHLKENSQIIELVPYTLLWDRSNNTLAEKYWLKIDGFWKSGELIYLPPVTNSSLNDSIDLILEIYGKK